MTLRCTLAGVGKILTLLLLPHSVTANQLSCRADDIATPEYFGIEVTGLEAKEVHGYDGFSPFVEYQNFPFDRKSLEFCNVTLTYTHPGWDDEVHVGGGWAAGAEGGQAPAVANGYAAAITDAGHSFYIDETGGTAYSKAWALTSPGNVNWPLLQDFASVALDDMTHLGKQITKSFYGKAAKYSYWNGCSTGGRQGLMQAQRYPKNYDGIMAAAPAINFATFVPAGLWAQFVMIRENYFPPRCEVKAIQQAAIEACDELDGLKDGVISAPGLCQFDAESVVGRKFDCYGDARKISKAAAKVTNAAYKGPRRKGASRSEWFGLTHETNLSDPRPGFSGLLDTVCDDNNKNCRGAPFSIGEDWIKMFLVRDPDYDWSTISEDEFFGLLHLSKTQYSSIISTDDPDLSSFRAAGGKMITWHGLADQLIFPNGSSNYYQRVLALDPEAAKFYRYFEAPGAAHCVGGIGPFPGKAFESLVKWVEEGIAPDTLEAATIPVIESDRIKYRPLCLYPLVASYIGGDPAEASSFKCAANFGAKKAGFSEHQEL